MEYLDSSKYGDLAKHSSTISSKELSQFITVRLNDVRFFGRSICSIEDMSSSESMEILLENNVVFDGIHPWVDIPVTILDVKAGYHLIKMSFIDPVTMDISSTFFSYTIQDSDPYKPYAYMKGIRNVCDPTKDGIYRSIEPIDEIMEDSIEGSDYDYGYEEPYFDDDLEITDDIDPVLEGYHLDDRNII